ncbi:hypothetical protein POM88_000837 [Heracleum sosnowskyi]|uniref:DC1 domain-containing protein n=1 Tax=Heracleum sosnowskyi TaxID=360622 RepID=A0AAD8JF04_9APIA|nr:hypothetical protein POM88_000837 [Heracleum sosnowskyi]
MFQAKELTITHVAHPQHPLALIHRPSSFKYDVCSVEENIKDMSDKCTYTTHSQCARSRSSETETYDSNLVYLPAADESSLNLLVEQFLKSMVDNYFSAEDRNPQWSHKHPLQLITNNELNNQKDDDRTVLLCDGCVKPIRTDGDRFYSCVLCKYFLHKYCAEISKKSVQDLIPAMACSSLGVLIWLLMRCTQSSFILDV